MFLFMLLLFFMFPASSAPKLEEELQFCATALLIKIKEKLNGTQTLVDEMIQGVDKLFDIFISMMQV